MKPRKLSNLAELLLGAVREATCFDDNGNVLRFFMPRTESIREIYGEEQGEYGLTVSGSGMAKILESLADKGLTKSEKFPYSYSITEDGMLAYEAIAARRRGARE